jgi:hypothetical protein
MVNDLQSASVCSSSIAVEANVGVTLFLASLERGDWSVLSTLADHDAIHPSLSAST